MPRSEIRYGNEWHIAWPQQKSLTTNPKPLCKTERYLNREDLGSLSPLPSNLEIAYGKLRAAHFSDDESDNFSLSSDDLDPDYSPSWVSGEQYRYPPLVDPSAYPFGAIQNRPVASSTNDRNHRSHMNPPLPMIRPQPQPGHARSSGQGSSSQLPRGRVGQLPHHQIRRDAHHPYKLSGPGPARDLALPQAPRYILPVTLKPTDNLVPETTADAENNNTLTEEEERMKRRKPRAPHRKEKNRDGRKKEQCDARELRHLVQQWKGLDDLPTRYEAVFRKNIVMKQNDAPDPIYCVADSYTYIESVRSRIYSSPRLVAIEPKQENLTDKVSARAERARRMNDRLLLQAIIKYYQMPGFMKVWGRPQLIRELLEDLKVRFPPPELSGG